MARASEGLFRLPEVAKYSEITRQCTLYLSSIALAVCSYAYRSEINQMLIRMQNYLRLNVYYQYYKPDRYAIAQEEMDLMSNMNTNQKRTEQVLKIVEQQARLIEQAGWDAYYNAGVDRKAVASALKFTNESGPKKLFASSSAMLYTDIRTNERTKYIMVIASGHQIEKMENYSPKDWSATFTRDSLFPNGGKVTLDRKKLGIATSIIKEGKRQDVGVLAIPLNSEAGRQFSSIIDLQSILQFEDISYAPVEDKEKLTGVCFAGSTTDLPLVQIARRREEQSYLDFGMLNADDMLITPGVCGCLAYDPLGRVVGVIGNAIDPAIFPEGADNGLMTLFADMEKDEAGNLVLFNQAIDNIPNN